MDWIDKEYDYITPEGREELRALAKQQMKGDTLADAVRETRVNGSNIIQDLENLSDSAQGDYEAFYWACMSLLQDYTQD